MNTQATRICRKCGLPKVLEDFYSYMGRNGHKWDFHVCKLCHRNRFKIWAQKTNWNARRREVIKKRRYETLTHYGGRCECCGYSDLDKKIHGEWFLQIDHMFGYKGVGPRGGWMLYYWLIARNYPEGFRVLCAGCNISIEPNEKKCELHKVN